MNSNWQETNRMPRKIIWKLLNLQALLMLIQVKEKEEKQFNMPNWTFPSKKEDLQSLTLQAIKTTSRTWSWEPVKQILLSWLSHPKKDSFNQVSKKRVRLKNMPCWLKLWVSLDFWWLLLKWVLKTGLRKGSIWLNNRSPLSYKTPVDSTMSLSFHSTQSIM